MKKIDSSEITPEHLYFSRRQFLFGAGALAASAFVLAACRSVAPIVGSTDNATATVPPGKLTSYNDITTYNNFYEFTTSKNGVAELAKNFKTEPWTVKVGGLVNNPATYSVADLIKKYPPAEHVYRMRCVEAWSMVIPWDGFQLSRLLQDADPKSAAKYVRFTAILDPAEMPGQNDSYYPWPYTEGLRLDEAMNKLTLLSTGLYGKPLPKQDGAPIRLVVPWKYGFKSIKSIVSIDLVEQMPVSFWMSLAPSEYGFYANVNPNVPHPRWSQASERRIGQLARIPTLMFNGYGPDVSYLYQGMDLKKNF